MLQTLRLPHFLLFLLCFSSALLTVAQPGKDYAPKIVVPTSPTLLGDTTDRAADSKSSKNKRTHRLKRKDRRMLDYAKSHMEQHNRHTAWIQHLSLSITFPTVSENLNQTATQKVFEDFHKQLKIWYPRTFSLLEVTFIEKYTILLHWKGTDQKFRKNFLFLAHQDVVPVDTLGTNQWTYPPFSGHIEDSLIYGRGTLDMKMGVIGILEAVEWLLSNGYVPRHDFYFVFGHDEETDGHGAKAAAEYFKLNNISFEFVSDEGGSMMQDLIPGVKGKLALIGVAEKGYASIQLLASGVEGHSSTPSANNSISILSRAIYRLENNPFPSKITTPVSQMLKVLGKQSTSWTRGFIMSNTWLFGRLIRKELESDPITQSLLRTTTAITMLSAGFKDNVLPSTALATVNFRILPGESINSILKYIKKVVDDDRIEFIVLPGATDPPKVSKTNTKAYKVLSRTIESLYVNTQVAPVLNISTSDSRYFADLTENILRFNPILHTPGDPERIHGTNERMHSRDFIKAVEFYYQFFLAADYRL